ncbi:MAG: DUF2132 domain-containing protein [Zhongshania sp.]|nr:DUF2132 domain-containing protein [Zhongshania sp.]
MKSKDATPPAAAVNSGSSSGSKDPLHGLTLEMVITRLEALFGWEELGRRIKIKCFTDDPSVSSSLKFLRRTPWARQKVEALYIRSQRPARKS